MNSKLIKLTVAALGIGATLWFGAGIVSSVVGQTQTGGNDHQDESGYAEDSGTTGSWLSASEIVTKLEARGYANIREVELEGGKYEVKALNAEGKPVELYADLHTGEILRSKYEQ